MKITFLGASGGVTGANYLLQIRKTQMIIDCGMFQSGDFVDELNHQNFVYDPLTLPYALITHAHLDHVGRLPKLYHEGFRGTIYATGPTRDLAGLIMEDAFGIMLQEAKHRGKQPLYSKEDVAGVMRLFVPVEYEHDLVLAKGVTARFYDAGHILGSAMIHVFDTFAKKSIVFSGDFGNDPSPILRSPTQVQQADAVVVESAYGNRVHEGPSDRSAILREIIERIIKNRGVLLIPAFSMERTQALLYMLNQLIETHALPQIPVFVDSPLALKITRIFKQYPQYYDKEARELIASGDDFLQFPGLVMTSSPRQSRTIEAIKPPKIIIAGSGMMHGGRIVNHLLRYLGDKRNMLLVVGFQVRGTLGRRLLEGAKQVRILGRDVVVRAEVRGLGGMSAHGDANMLLKWVKNIHGAKRVFVVQGDPEAANALVQKINENTTAKALAPGLGYSEDF